ncbi:MAG: Ig domain-containing protein, partial [Limisphaerales bacterium]
MKPTKTSTWAIVFAGLAALLTGNPASASDVLGFRVLKGQNFIQTGTGAATPEGVSSVVMQCVVEFQTPGALTNVTFTKPNSQVVTVNADGNSKYTFEQSFSSVVDLDAAFPDGNYTVTMKTVNDGIKEVMLPLTGGAYSATPHINNFTAAQTVDPNLDFTLMWDDLGAVAGAYVFLSIRDGGSNTVFSSPDMGQPGVLDNTSTSMLIPARKLRPGQVYQVEMFVAQGPQMPDTTSYPGATGIAAYFKQLHFNLTTTGTQTGTALGQFNLGFSFARGFFDGTNGSIGFPEYLVNYFALYNIDNDVNYPATVIFSGPAGSGLTNTTNQYNGSMFGTSAYYASPQVEFTTNAHPPGGVYTVNYKGVDRLFNLLPPLSADQQILAVPTVVLTSTNTIQEIRWTYRTTNGTVVGPQPFMDHIEIRVDGINGGRLYDGGLEDSRILPSVTNHTVTNAVVAWTNVSMIQMLFVDTANNQYVTYWQRAIQPFQITTASLPDATQGTAYSFLLSGQGGTQPVTTWSIESGFLPSGLNLVSATGEIVGTPGESGTFPLSFRATDSASAVTNRALTLTVTASSFAAPGFTNYAVIGTTYKQISVNLIGITNQTYTLETSTNLIS